MTTFPTDEVLAALVGLDRYQVRADLQDTMHIEGIVEPREHAGALRIGVRGADVAEVRWRDGVAVGHRLDSGRWLGVRNTPPGYVLLPDAEFIRNAAQGEVVQEGPDWVLTIRDARVPIGEDPEGFVLGLLGPPVSGEDPARREQMAQSLRELRVDIELRVARDEPNRLRVAVRARLDGRLLLHVAIQPTTVQVPPLPREVGVPQDSVPFSALVLTLPSLGGWTQRDCHARWAQRSLDLLKMDSDRRYEDLYAKGWSTSTYDDSALGANPDAAHHPIVNGAFYEDEKTMPAFYAKWFNSDADYIADPDYYWKQAGYCRDYNHFGGEGVGLEDRWYFALRPGCPSYGQNLVNGRFYSARDWGHGGARIDESLNRLTFTQAIRQFNTYTFDGKRRAYAMLGHVVHLLQDQGQPDHARLCDHAGSSMDEKQAYGEYNYCHFLALEAAAAAALACWGPWSIACAAVAFGVAEAACWASASSSVVGFERLIGAPIGGTTHWRLSDVDSAIDAQGVIANPPSTYDAYFKTISDASTSEATSGGLDSALGCETLALVPPIPHADPAIDTTTTDPVPFLALTKVLVPKVVGLSAGLMRHFYDIVNHPPILERLTVVQWRPRATPLEFGVLDRSAPDHCTRYDGRWVLSGSQRTLTMGHQPQVLSLDRPAYVFLLFGPLKTGSVPELGRRMNRVEVLVTGRNLSTGTQFSDPLHLKEMSDPSLGYYYVGSFLPHNCAPDPYQITFEVSGEDEAAHLSGRSGAGLDADPRAPATVDETDPLYGWRNYVPGADRQHTIMVSAASWRLETSPQKLQFSTRIRGDRSGTFELRATERHLDCHVEEYWGLTRCPVTWSLQPQVKDMVSGTNHDPEELGLSVDLLGDRQQTAMVTAQLTEAYALRHRMDHYQIFVDHTIGEGSYLVTGTNALDVWVQ